MREVSNVSHWVLHIHVQANIHIPHMTFFFLIKYSKGSVKLKFSREKNDKKLKSVLVSLWEA